MLAKIHDGIVVEIIPDFDPTFPGVPIEERYSPEFLKGCVPCDETVQQRHTYAEGKFSEPIPQVEEIVEEIIPEETVEDEA